MGMTSDTYYLHSMRSVYERRWSGSENLNQPIHFNSGCTSDERRPFLLAESVIYYAPLNGKIHPRKNLIPRPNFRRFSSHVHHCLFDLESKLESLFPTTERNIIHAGKRPKHTARKRTPTCTYREGSRNSSDVFFRPPHTIRPSPSSGQGRFEKS